MLSQRVRVQTMICLPLFVVWTAMGAAPATGPLRVHPTNPRYFTDGTKNRDRSLRAVYLTGSHTWGNLCDYRDRWPAFDFSGYLDFLNRYHHNFIRLWSGDGLGHQPVPYARTGPGTAKDGGLKVDLDRFDPAFFDRLRCRVVLARDRGVYVGIVLFSPDSGAKREDWDNLLYHPTNNVQGINADTNKDGSGAEAYDLSIPRITACQEAFVRKAIDTVNDLDNVLYELGNEGDLTSVAWWSAYLGGSAWEAHVRQPYDQPLSAWERIWTELGGTRAFMESLPFWEMVPTNDVVRSGIAFCLAKQGEVYALYLPADGPVIVELPSEHPFTAACWNPGNMKDGLFQNESNLASGRQQLVPPGSGDCAVKIVRLRQSAR